eukprot:1148183-Pelagomonas_calceolata.AAC.1
MRGYRQWQARLFKEGCTGVESALKTDRMLAYAHKPMTTRHAIENECSSHSQVLEPGGSRLY